MATDTTIYYKVINVPDNHPFGKKYTLGINTVDRKFDPKADHDSYCLHYLTFDQIGDRIAGMYYLYDNSKIAVLQLCEDSYSDQFCIEWGKTDKFNIIKFYDTRDFIDKYTMELVMQNGFVLKYIKNQTPKLCMAAVQQNGRALAYVNKPTSKIYLIAAQQYAHALSVIETRTQNICVIAVQQNWNMLIEVKDKTYELCMIAMRQNKNAIVCIAKQTHELYMMYDSDATKYKCNCMHRKTNA